jgi:hypothetical protein
MLLAEAFSTLGLSIYQDKKSRQKPQKYPQSPEKLKTPLIPPLMLSSNL